MIRALIVLVLVGAITWQTQAQNTEGSEPILIGNDLPFQAGISVVLYINDTTMDVNSVSFFDDLERRNLGVESIIFTFPIFQNGVSSITVYEDEVLTISEEGLRAFIQEAHRRNITVWLKPLIDDGRLGVGRWRGSITPGGDLSNLAALDAWFASYGELILKYAQIAQDERALGLIVGTEMASLDKPMPKYTDRWNHLIAQVREIYNGNVAYAKNWSPVDLPGFASSLDVLMIDAFFDLQSLPDHASEEQILQAWYGWLGTLNWYQEALDIPVMFAEVGIVPRVGSYRTPWNGNNGRQVDWEAQYYYYRATCRFALEVGIDGLYWWAVGFHDHFENQFERYQREGMLTYNFYDVAAEHAVRDCYQNQVSG